MFPYSKTVFLFRKLLFFGCPANHSNRFALVHLYTKRKRNAGYYDEKKERRGTDEDSVKGYHVINRGY